MSLIFKLNGYKLRTDGEPELRQYDKNSRKIIVRGDRPSGFSSFSMCVSVNGSNYDAVLLSVNADNELEATLTDSMLAFGNTMYQFQLEMASTNGDVKAHSSIVNVFVPASIDGDVEFPTVPSAFTQAITWANNLNVSATKVGNVVTLTITKKDGTTQTVTFTEGGFSIHGLTTEDTLSDTDETPFYDTSASANRKTTWLNIKAKLKAYFDTLYNKVTKTSELVNDSGFLMAHQSLAAYRTSAAQDVIDATKAEKFIVEFTYSGASVTTETSLADIYAAYEAGKIVEGHSRYVGGSTAISRLRIAQKEIDGATTSYLCVFGLLASDDTDDGVISTDRIFYGLTNGGTDAWYLYGNTLYAKPNSGIPSTDMTSAVQASLALADSALQSHQDISGLQEKLTAGQNITIAADGKTISASGGGLSTTAKALLMQVLKKGVYTESVETLLTQLETALGFITISQNGTTLIINNVPTVTAIAQTGTTLALT